MMPFQRAFMSLGVAALILGAVVASELLLPVSSDTVPASMPHPSHLLASPGLRTSLGPEQEQARVARLLARPLFNHGRHPTVGAAPVATSMDLPRLAGVLVSSQVRNAIFAATGDSKPVVVGVGGNVGTFRVQAIEAGQVTIIGADGGARLLRPSVDPRPPSVHVDAAVTRDLATGVAIRPRPKPAVVTLSAPSSAADAGSARAGTAPPR